MLEQKLDTYMKDGRGDVYKRILKLGAPTSAGKFDHAHPRFFPLGRKFRIDGFDTGRGEVPALAEICAQKSKRTLTQPRIILLERHDVVSNYSLLFFYGVDVRERETRYNDYVYVLHIYRESNFSRVHVYPPPKGSPGV